MQENRRRISFVVRTVCVCLLAVSIPCLLIFNGIQAQKYTALQRDVEALEKRQEELVEQNKKLITDISLLSSSDRIERIAENELGMRPAESDEIVRVEMRDARK